MYDVIVIGARAAGAPTAMLLARKGLKVLLVDRANFPSDTLSTHQVQLKGVAALRRWGLLDKVLETNCPPVQRLSFRIGRYHLQGKYQPLEGLEGILCPRRTYLDKILVDAAVEAGAELRTDFLVEGLTNEDGVVTGIHGRSKSGLKDGASLLESARWVIGADGKHSLVAREAGAKEYSNQTALTCAYYTYWEGITLEYGELHNLPEAVVGLWPTNDGQVIIYTGYPIGEFPAIRGDIEKRFWRTMESVPHLAERLREGRQAERFNGTADLPGFFRCPYGAGWALVGDASLSLDPITGQGIGNAFCDAERLARAIESGFSGEKPMEKALALYEKERNADVLPMYKFTNQIASFTPASWPQDVLFASMEKKPRETDQFFGMLTGSVTVKEFFSPGNLIRIMGIWGIGKMVFGMKRTVATSKLAAAN